MTALPVRLLALLALLLAAPLAAAAADAPALRGDVVASRDTLTLGDLVRHAPAALAETPLFRAPALGASGTIQAKRILAAADALGLPGVETGGHLQVTVTRAARRIAAPAIEDALRAALAREAGTDSVLTGFSFDGPSPSLLLPPEALGDAAVAELSFDRRSRRFAATVYVGPSAAERRGQLRVSGTAVELVSVAVLGRALERGEAAKAADITLERRARDSLGPDAAHDGTSLEGRVARRALAAGTLLRPGDLARPEIVGRGELVTAVFEAPGVTLAMRARANEAGAMGDTVSLVNLQSKKTIQGVVVAPGRVSVSAALPGRVASAAQP